MAGMQGLAVVFAGGTIGEWRVERIDAVAGPPLTPVPRLAVIEGRAGGPPPEALWVLRGVTSHERYVELREREALVAREQPLGRHEATHAALIPISKSESWWELPQDERRRIFEER